MPPTLPNSKRICYRWMQRCKPASCPTWPGPVTWLLPVRPEVSPLIRGNHDTLAVRISAHPVCRELCQQLGHPLISTSANRSDQPPARSAAEVWQQFGHKLSTFSMRHSVNKISPPKSATDLLGKLSARLKTVSIRCHANSNPRQALMSVPADQWNALVQDDNPFLRHEFLAALEHHGCVEWKVSVGYRATLRFTNTTRWLLRCRCTKKTILTANSSSTMRGRKPMSNAGCVTSRNWCPPSRIRPPAGNVSWCKQGAKRNCSRCCCRR